MVKSYNRALARKLQTFSRNWEIRLVFTKGHHHGRLQEKHFLVQPVKRWKTPTWEWTISEDDIIQHTQITTEKRFFFDYHKLSWDME